MNTYHSPIFLKPNSHVRILCTARLASAEKLQPARDWLHQMGYRSSLGNTIGKQHHQYGGTDEQRLEDFTAALKDPDVDAIWVARGGYGTVKIVDAIDRDLIYQSRKLLMGYSDVTHLHGLWQVHGLQSMHTFMPQEFKEKNTAVLDSWLAVARGNSQSVSIMNEHRLPPQKRSAPIVGGNLSVLASMIGSATFPSTEGAFLLLEDLDELLYHIDRLMTMLRRAGKLDRLAGLLVGGMTGMRDHDIKFGKNAHEIIHEHTAAFDYPVIYNVPTGHIKNNHSFMLGKSTTVDITKTSITITQ